MHNYESVTGAIPIPATPSSAIAHEFGGTIDKFIGDAMLIFFGDPETKGDRANAQACLQMAWRMQHRLTELNAKWRPRVDALNDATAEQRHHHRARAGA